MNNLRIIQEDGIDSVKEKVSLYYGDILSTDEKVIGHGCNCFNNMWTGIARIIRTKYPEAYKKDLQTTKGDQNKLGNYTHSYIDKEDRYIFNLYTQYTFWDREKMFYAWALENALKNALSLPYIEKIAIPAIGTGLSNGTIHDLVFSAVQASRASNKEVSIYFLDRKSLNAAKKELRKIL